MLTGLWIDLFLGETLGQASEVSRRELVGLCCQTLGSPHALGVRRPSSRNLTRGRMLGWVSSSAMEEASAALASVARANVSAEPSTEPQVLRPLGHVLRSGALAQTPALNYVSTRGPAPSVWLAYRSGAL